MFKTLQEVPEKIRTRRGAPLTLDQANRFAALEAAVSAAGIGPDATSVAWAAWAEVYELKAGAWTERPRDKKEALLLLEEVVQVASCETVETDKDGLPSKAKVAIILAGPTKTKGRNYPAEALKDLAESGLLDGLHMYDAHPPGSEQVPGASQAPRKVSELLSYVIPGTVAFDESLKNDAGDTVGGITATVELVDHDFREDFSKKSPVIGISLNAIWDAVSKAGVDFAKKARKAISADWVPKPNAGGRTLAIVEAEDLAVEPGSPTGKEVNNNMQPALMNWGDLTPDLLRANCPQIITWIEDQMKDKQRAADALVAAATQDAEARVSAAKTETDAAKAEATAAKAEAQEAKTKLENQQREYAENEAKASSAALKVKAIEAVEAKCEGLNVLAKSEVMKAVLAKEFKTEAEMTEAVDAEVAKFPKPKPAAGAAPANGGDAPKMPQASRTYAESLGYTPEEIKRLEEVSR